MLDLDHPSLKVAAIEIKLDMLLQGVHSLNAIILLGCETLKNSTFHIDSPTVNENTQFQRLMNEIFENGSIAAAFSSEIIYAHAMCETVLMDICELIRRVDCDDWVRDIVNNAEGAIK
ncbi:MAG TPA: hypothetical protein DCF68_18390 [Cyanothece sp. UBA12306]|nr:hypothetical protein [Cyanothece sp. UBA12306]